MQQVIAGGMSAMIVRRLKAGDIDAQQGGAGLSPAGMRQDLLESIQNQIAIRQPGQTVVSRLVLQALELPDPYADIVGCSDVTRNLTEAIDKRSHGLFRAKELVALHPVVEGDTELASTAQPGP